MNKSRIPPDDPRLTAYALGELEGGELAEVEAALRADPAAQSAVAEIRIAAGLLTDALVGETAEAAAMQRGKRKDCGSAPLARGQPCPVDWVSLRWRSDRGLSGRSVPS